MEFFPGLVEEFATWSLVVMAGALVLLFLSPLISIVVQGLALVLGLLYAIFYGIFCFFRGLFGGLRR